MVLHDLLSEVYFEQLRVLMFLPTRVNEMRNVPLIEILLWKRVRSFFPSSEEKGAYAGSDQNVLTHLFDTNLS